MLVIENTSLIMQEVKLPHGETGVVGGKKIYGLLGFIQIYPVSYLLVITGHKLIYELTVPERTRIYEITDTELIVLSKEGTATVNKEYEQAISKIMRCGFYYSPDTDLTQRFGIEEDDDQEPDHERCSELLPVSK